MKYSLTTAGLLALTGSVTMAASIPRSKGTHVINLKRDEVAYKTAIARQSGNSTVKRENDGGIGLDYSGYWFADVNVGGQNVQALLDTGSADFWLVPPTDDSSVTQGVETWDPNTASGTSLMSGYSFNIGYGQGGNGVQGPVYQAPVCMGSACTNMAVGSATYDQGLGTFPRSGILGLAFQGGNSVSPNKQNTFMEAIQGKLDSPIFVTKFSAGSDSQIAFGGIDFNYQAPLQQISIDTQRYPYSWSFVGAQYSVNGQSLGSFDVVFDTGGPMSSAAEGIVRGYYAQVPGAQDVNGDASTWFVPCGTTLPDLRLDLGSALLIIPGFRFYNGNTATSGSCQTWFVKENSATRGVIGDPFFAEHVVVFNQQAQTIQWGNQA